MKRMNELLESVNDFVDIIVDSGQPTTNTFSVVVMIHEISSDFKST